MRMLVRGDNLYVGGQVYVWHKDYASYHAVAEDNKRLFDGEGFELGQGDKWTLYAPLPLVPALHPIARRGE